MFGTEVTSRWIDVWAGAVTVNAMCVALSGRGGYAITPGYVKIELELGPRWDNNGVIGALIGGQGGSLNATRFNITEDGLTATS